MIICWWHCTCILLIVKLVISSKNYVLACGIHWSNIVRCSNKEFEPRHSSREAHELFMNRQSFKFLNELNVAIIETNQCKIFYSCKKSQSAKRTEEWNAEWSLFVKQLIISKKCWTTSIWEQNVVFICVILSRKKNNWLSTAFSRYSFIHQVC